MDEEKEIRMQFMRSLTMPPTASAPISTAPAPAPRRVTAEKDPVWPDDSFHEPPADFADLQQQFVELQKELKDLRTELHDKISEAVE